MEKSEVIANIAKALSIAQGSMRFAKKDSENPFYKSHYADLAANIEAAKPHLAANNLAVVQGLKLVDNQWVISSVLLHSSGEWIGGMYPVSPMKNDPQSFGSAVSYARRYSFQALIGLAAADDDGNSASEKPGKQPPTKVTAPLPEHLSASKLDNSKLGNRPVVPENPWLWKLQGESEHRGKPIGAITDDKIEALKEEPFRKSLVKTGMLTKFDNEAIVECLKNFDALELARAEIAEMEDYNGRTPNE